MIFFITQRDPFFVDHFFETFDKFGNKYTIINLPNFNVGFTSAIMKTFKLYGVGGFLFLLKKKLLKLMKPILLKNIIKQHNFKSIDDAKNIIMKLSEEDIVVSLSAPCKIPVEWLSGVKAKINIHCGKLPKYAGVMPIFWQINDGLHEISITLQDIAKEIDSGKIFIEKKINLSNSLFETTRLAKQESANILKNFILNIENNLKNVNDHSLIYDKIILRKFPTKKEIQNFKKTYRLI